MELINQVFDYSILEKDDKGILIRHEADIVKSRRRVARELIEHGKVLHQVQQLLSNYSGGTWTAWIDSMGISNGSAYNAISAYVEFGSFPNLENIEVSAMYALAKNKKAKNKALKLADSGVKVTHAMAKQLIDDTGEDGRTDSDGMEPQELPPEPPRNGTEQPGDSELPDDSGQEWEDDWEFRTTEPPPEPVAPDPGKTRNLAHQYRDKLARAICDHHELSPNRAERDRLVKLVQGVKLW